MPRDGAITFCDIAGKLAVLRVTCDKCGRSGQYRVDRLIMRYGIDAKLFDWEPEGDCPRKIARNDYDPCRGLEQDPVVASLSEGLCHEQRTVSQGRTSRQAISERRTSPQGETNGGSSAGDPSRPAIASCNRSRLWDLPYWRF